MDYQTRWVRHTRFRVNPYSSRKDLSYTPSPHSKTPTSARILRSPSGLHIPSPPQPPKVLETSSSDLLQRLSPSCVRRLAKSKTSKSPILAKFSKPKETKPNQTFEESPEDVKIRSFSPTRNTIFTLATTSAELGIRSPSVKKINQNLEVCDTNEVSTVSDVSFYEKSKVKYISEANSFINDTVYKLGHEKARLRGVTFKQAYEHPYAKKFFELIKAGITEEVERLILKSPELVRAVDSTQQTAMHWASKRNNLRLVQFLLSKHADVGARDITGRKAEDIARQRGLKDMHNYLSAVRATKQANMLHIFKKKLIKHTLENRGKILEHQISSEIRDYSYSSRKSALPIRIPKELIANFKRHSAIGPVISKAIADLPYLILNKTEA